MKEISSIDFPQHGEVFYFYGQALHIIIPLELLYLLKNRIKIRWVLLKI
jgi:hypothetical protein